MNDILSRADFEKLLEKRIGKRLRSDMNQAVRQLERWDKHHAGSCKCPPGEPHGVRLLSEDWGGMRQEEGDDWQSYDVLDEVTKERFGQ